MIHVKHFTKDSIAIGKKCEYGSVEPGSGVRVWRHMRGDEFGLV
jgi:hypothetical protein